MVEICGKKLRVESNGKTATQVTVYISSADGKNEIIMPLPTEFYVMPGSEYHIICSSDIGNWKYLGKYDMTSFDGGIEELVVNIEFSSDMLGDLVKFIKSETTKRADEIFGFIATRMKNRFD